MMLLTTSLLYAVFSLSNWQLINDLLYFVPLGGYDYIVVTYFLTYLLPLGGYAGRTCDGLLITDDARQRYDIGYS